MPTKKNTPTDIVMCLLGYLYFRNISFQKSYKLIFRILVPSALDPRTQNSQIVNP